jgi:TRAP-type C4-dicarboxylate transport system substrate-binding protein
MIKWWANEITKRTEGKVKFQFFWGGSLIKLPDMISGIASGVADIGFIVSTYDPAKTSLWMNLDLPLNAKDYWCGMQASKAAAQEDPALKAELEKNGFKPLVGYASGFAWIVTKKPVTKITDLKGKKIRAYGGAFVPWMEELGMSPVFMNMADVYEAIDRGVVDGTMLSLTIAQAFKFYEVTKYFTPFGNNSLGLASPFASINLKLWNSFPESLKKIFRDVSYEHDIRFARGLEEFEGKLLKDFQEKNGVKVGQLSADDVKLLEETGKRVRERFLAQGEAKGLPVRKTWTKYEELYRACEAEVAAKGYPWGKR